MSRRTFRSLRLVVLGILLLHTAAAIFLAEVNLRLPHKPLKTSNGLQATADAIQYGSKLSNVQIESFDGTKLAAWYYAPGDGNHPAVILLHGHGDNRAGMLPFVPMFLSHHFAVLVPDARAHGQSGGTLATFGVDESRDLSRWVDWMRQQPNTTCIYGLGESMGAAILLQTLPTEPRFCAGVAEAPYASFYEVALDRLSQKLGWGMRVGHVLFAPMVREGFLYVRLRYGVDLDLSDSASAAARTHVPVLLIHGNNDFNIPVVHCVEILKNHSGVMNFWQVPDAGHTGAFGTDPDEFERRVLSMFSSYGHGK